MTVLIDLGTSRTAVAATDKAGGWVDLSTPRTDLGIKDANWAELELLIRGVAGTELVRGAIPHVRNYSRYFEVGNLVLPASISGSSVRIPAGIQLYPDSRGTVFSIKQDPAQAEKFLRAIRRLVSPLVGEGGQWVVGRSCGGIDPKSLGLPGGTQTFNEATAVLFAALRARVFASDNEENVRYAIIADLGGGFLDVAVADEITYSDGHAGADIVSFGGYPLGVDRVAERFDESEISGGEALLALLRLAVDYHVWDYHAHRRVSDERTRGVLVLTGGGFRRLEKSVSRRRMQQILTANLGGYNIDVIWPNEDTKALTLSGLRLLSSQGKVTSRDLNREISAENPNFHGRSTLRSGGFDPGAATTWASLIDDLRRTAFTENG